MELTKAFWKEETNAKKRQFYHCPLPKKKPRVTSPSQSNGPVRRFTPEQVFLENLKRLAWKGDFQT